MFFHYDKLNSVLDEDALYGKIGQILNQLDVEQINNEIETENLKIENESENYFRYNELEDLRWVMSDKILLLHEVSVNTHQLEDGHRVNIFVHETIGMEAGLTTNNK